MGFDATRGLVAAVFIAVLACAPAASAETAWTCSASTGWVAAGGSRADAAALGGAPCPVAKATPAPATSGAAALRPGKGSVEVDGGSASATTDTRKPQASVSLDTVALTNADGLNLTVSKLRAAAAGSCNASHVPVFTSSSSVGQVTLGGRPIHSTREYSEPGVGVNGAPLFGRLVIRFAEAEADAASRRAVHVIATDRGGAVVFEAVAGEVAAGRSGPVCDPPPVCPPGTEPRDGRCVQVDAALPPPPQAPAAPLPTPVPTVPGAPQPGVPEQPRAPRGCDDANAVPGSVSTTRLRTATLCVMNAERARRKLRRLRLNDDLSRAAARHARDMVLHRFFSHSSPDGRSMVDRILRSGYLRRYGRWSVAENLGWGYARGGTPAAIVAAWMKSPPHRRNILSARYLDVGVAVRPGSPGRRRSRSATYVIDFGGFVLVRR